MILLFLLWTKESLVEGPTKNKTKTYFTSPKRNCVEFSLSDESVELFKLINSNGGGGGRILFPHFESKIIFIGSHADFSIFEFISLLV